VRAGNLLAIICLQSSSGVQRRLDSSKRDVILGQLSTSRYLNQLITTISSGRRSPMVMEFPVVAGGTMDALDNIKQEVLGACTKIVGLQEVCYLTLPITW